MEVLAALSVTSAVCSPLVTLACIAGLSACSAGHAPPGGPPACAGTRPAWRLHGQHRESAMVPAWQPALEPGSVAAGLARETLLDACGLPGGCHPSTAPLQVTCQGWQYFVGALPTGWSGTLPGVFCDVRTYHCSAHCCMPWLFTTFYYTSRGGLLLTHVQIWCLGAHHAHSSAQKH